MYETLLLDKKNQIATITLNRPEKRNAINTTLKNELAEALDELGADAGVRVVIITGAGTAFSSGVEQKTEDFDDDDIECFVGFDTEEKLVKFDKPVIAAINGYALGDGLQIAMLCDILIASEKAVLGFIGARLGGMCFSAVWALPWLVGLNKASELLFTCDRISPEEAFRIGLVNKVVPHEQLMPSALEMAEKIKRSAPLSIKYTKRALRRGMFPDDTRKFLKPGFLAILTSDDIREARKAFLEKREPVFKGE